ncbi:MAG TPA: radical SAM protein [Spirochaetota bacterium]|nr:radical SAM protein [Spirochaetota bacterium]HOM38525.1 radical SAM protein [Spirochaetota bacterium]HPQ49065.1 radical SAM protein [Spirochaetota bacterium]
MLYDYPLFRPPSEADSLIIQASIGCSHNKCLFCYMYKSKTFRLRALDDIKVEIENISKYVNPKKIFIADGDVLAADTDYIISLLNLLRYYYPSVKRISCYGSASNIIKKSDNELSELKSLGLNLVYIGLESGDDKVLEFMHKGSSVKDNIESVIRLKKAGIKTSVMAILGLGGKDRTLEHAINTGRAVSLMNPDFFSTLTLIVDNASPLYPLVRNGMFKLLTDDKLLIEHIRIIENIEGKNIIFRSNHASNLISIGGILSRDKEDIINNINSFLKTKNYRKTRLL